MGGPGWRLAITVCLIFTMVPLIYLASLRYGPVGAASVWALLNLVYMGVGVPLTHARILPGEARRWFLVDVALPLAVSVMAVGIARWVLRIDPSQRFSSTIVLGGVLLIVVLHGHARLPNAPEMDRRPMEGMEGPLCLSR